MSEWAPVLGYETIYEISRSGDIRRTARGKKVDAARIPAARAMLAEGATLKVVAAFLDVSIQTVASIKRQTTWQGDCRYREVKSRLDRHGYRYTTLSKDGKPAQHRVHRLVWEAFNGAIPGRLEVNHRNLVRDDNRLENLELLTHRQNVQHAFDIYRNEPSSQIGRAHV